MKTYAARVGMWSRARTAAMIGVVVWAGSVLALAAHSGAPSPQAVAGTPKKAGTSAAGSVAIARGKYLVDAMGCHDCHTPMKMGDNGPEPDMTRALSGHPQGKALPTPPPPNGPWITSVSDTFTAWTGPWGISYTRNLTPDKETGLGEWTEQQFLDTIRTGRRQGRGRQLLPPMPWPAIKNLNDADLKAIFAYLQSLEPMANRVPEPVLAEPPK